MEEADKDWMMIRMVGGWVFLLVLVHPGSPRWRAVKWLLLLFCSCVSVCQIYVRLWLVVGIGSWCFHGTLLYEMQVKVCYWYLSCQMFLLMM